MITNNDLYTKYGDNIVFLFKGNEPYVESDDGNALGVLIEKDGKILCNECQGWYASLGNHVHAHGMKISDYKLKHGFNKSVGLVSTETSAKLRERELEYRRKNPEKSKLAQKALDKGHKTMQQRPNPNIGSTHRMQKLNQRNACPEQMKTRLKMLMEKYGEHVSTNTIKEVDPGLNSYGRRHFGTWNKYKQHLGLTIDTSTKKIKKGELIYSLRAYVQKYNSLPWDNITKGSYNDFPYSTTPYTGRFGSLKQALFICGIGNKYQHRMLPNKKNVAYKYWFLIN